MLIIIGGISYDSQKNRRKPCTTIHVTLEPKGLKQFAIQTVHQNKTVLPWEEVLPKSLRSLLHVL